MDHPRLRGKDQFRIYRYKKSITNILYKVKTEKDLADTKMENPSYCQEGKQIEKGKIDLLSNGQRLITLFQTADESTFAHKMGHMFLMDLEELAKIDDKSAKELGITPAYAGKTRCFSIVSPMLHDKLSSQYLYLI